MAVCTGISLMRLEREPGCIMVKRYLLPSTGIVAGGTLCAIGSIVSIICRVTGGTILRSAFEDPVLMTALTSHSRVLTIEVEGKFGVIHLRRLPACGGVTTSALSAKLAFMRVVLGVAGGAILRCAFEDAVLMTVFASHGGMFSIKMEGKFGVIHLRILPAFGSMAGRTIGSKLTVMMVVRRVTGDARLGSVLQISKLAGTYMALGAYQRCMFADQVERHLVMVKVRAMRLHPVVTGHTIRAECEEVFCREYLIILQMTITARFLVERRSVSFYMAILAGKRSSVRFGFMSREFKGNRIVIKRGGTPAIGAMTGSALCAETARVSIIIQMTGRTIHGCTFEDIILMAVRTSCSRMFPI